ncbi:bifunctional diguanylate cyclase/phosphodiesterase [Leptothrix discophora]|uniref:Bifunctional diguanylate cyclase/phosphodiesterase n=1 Tax=Leptothrix discophora TaxID=89 RepID=A0ABT9G4Q7_LEPDI|nr:bifunctional diguanylate cyclase/phosphodiesterase [Leptothrix discophora]MDP4301464.1 bifunctional diguanylate cyclase/phosphodiesterase [Leptothrix discophora]
MKTLRIVILDDGGDVPPGLRSGQLPGLDLRQLEGLSGADAAALLREHSMPAPFVDTSLDSLSGPPSDFAHSELESELRHALQPQPGQPVALLLGYGDIGPDSPLQAAGGGLPFERLNASLMRALRRHELEAALAESDSRLRRMGLADRQTGLPSRELFLDRLEQAAASVMRGGNAFATLVIGFEWPQGSTDTLSSAGADTLIEALARRLKRLGRRSDSYARIGGHTFAALLLGNNSVAGTTAMAHKITEQLARPVMVDGRSLDPKVRVGIALCPQHGTDARSVMLHAQAAMEQAQHSRREVAVYDARLGLRAGTGAGTAQSATLMRADAVRPPPTEEALATQFAHALAQDELGLVFQPVVNLHPGADGSLDWTLRRLEALTRWHSASWGPVGPSTFIPIAEHHALIAQLTDRMLERALRAASPWREQGLVPALSINLSARLLDDPDLPERLGAILEAHQWPAKALMLELPATALSQPGAVAQDVIHRLCQLGVRLIVDDLGSGLSAYLALAELGAFAELKVDLRSLGRSPGHAAPAPSPERLYSGLGGSAPDRGAAVLSSLLTLAAGLGAQVVVTGVEDAETAAWLLKVGCHAAQGYAWSRPLPPEQVKGWCAAQAATRGLKH